MLLLQVVERAELLAEVAVGLLQVEVALQVDAVVLLQRVVGDLQVPLQLLPLLPLRPSHGKPLATLRAKKDH